jgi:hypothetical protein
VLSATLPPEKRGMHCGSVVLVVLWMYQSQSDKRDAVISVPISSTLSTVPLSGGWGGVRLKPKVKIGVENWGGERAFRGVWLKPKVKIGVWSGLSGGGGLCGKDRTKRLSTYAQVFYKKHVTSHFEDQRGGVFDQPRVKSKARRNEPGRVRVGSGEFSVHLCR